MNMNTISCLFELTQTELKRQEDLCTLIKTHGQGQGVLLSLINIHRVECVTVIETSFLPFRQMNNFELHFAVGWTTYLALCSNSHRKVGNIEKFCNLVTPIYAQNLISDPLNILSVLLTSSAPITLKKKNQETNDAPHY